MNPVIVPYVAAYVWPALSWKMAAAAASSFIRSSFRRRCPVVIRCLLAAGIVRDFEFLKMEHLEVYLYQLDHRKVNYKVIETFERSDGTVLVRIVQQYNNADLIQL